MVKIEALEESSERLEEIVMEIHQYLDDFTRNRLFLFVGKSYFQKCCRSWIKVSNHLDRFLLDPKIYYSTLILIIDHEKKKFPTHSFYCKKLKELEMLLIKGPHFTVIIEPN